MFSSEAQEERFLAAIERIATVFEKMAEPHSPPEKSPEDLEVEELARNSMRMSHEASIRRLRMDDERLKNEWARIRREREEFKRDGIELEAPPEPPRQARAASGADNGTIN